MSGKYHHGDLRAALVRAALDLIAEQGPGGFSVAAVARRAKVSPGAPYRHFPDRESLLAAVATTIAREVTERVKQAAERHDDPVDALAAAVGAYTDYLIERRAGLDVIYSDDLQGPRHTELHEHTRRMIDEFLLRCLAVTNGPREALELLEQLFTHAHGYGSFWLDGFFAKQGYSPELVVRKSARAARITVEGYRHLPDDAEDPP